MSWDKMHLLLASRLGWWQQVSILLASNHLPTLCCRKLEVLLTLSHPSVLLIHMTAYLCSSVEQNPQFSHTEKTFIGWSITRFLSNFHSFINISCFLLIILSSPSSLELCCDWNISTSTSAFSLLDTASTSHFCKNIIKELLLYHLVILGITDHKCLTGVSGPNFSQNLFSQKFQKQFLFHLNYPPCYCS